MSAATPQHAGDLILLVIVAHVCWALWRAWSDERRDRREDRRQLASMSRHGATIKALAEVPPPHP